MRGSEDRRRNTTSSERGRKRGENDDDDDDDDNRKKGKINTLVQAGTANGARRDVDVDDDDDGGDGDVEEEEVRVCVYSWNIKTGARSFSSRGYLVHVGPPLSSRATCRPVSQCAPTIMPYCILLVPLLIAATVEANVYLPSIKEEKLMLTDALLREMISQMGKELADAADTYLEYPEKVKELPIELPADYDAMDINPNPSIRDQEYLQHSTLWSHQRINNNNNKGNDRHRIQSNGLKGIKDEKTENPLPAYCTPPNPCPVGYTSENNCLTNFENTAAFSRDYQSAQDCMCDSEHMLECSSDTGNSNGLSNVQISNSDFDQIVEQFQEENPFFRGEKLPIAAKKGIHVID